jgi:glycosyltransferase involved in cell wall biosynthesis
MLIPYSALIRTFNSGKTLPDTLHSLSAQTICPAEYIFVDSGSTDNTLSILPDKSIVHNYIGQSFNYSDALNQGIKCVSTDYVLIISSHNTLQNCDAIEYALRILKSSELVGAAYFSDEITDTLRHAMIDKYVFDGFNGLWNTCSLIKVDLLRRRNFRREVFTAEDQEWARWLFYCERKVTARIMGGGLSRQKKYTSQKWLNEYVSIAYFANRSLLRLPNLARIIYKVVKPTLHIGPKERLFNLVLLFSLLACYIAVPKYKVYTETKGCSVLSRLDSMFAE